MNKFIFNFHGWTKSISVVNNFEVRPGRRFYDYILKLPEIEYLGEES